LPQNSTFSPHIKVLKACGTCGEEEYGTRGFGGNTQTMSLLEKPRRECEILIIQIFNEEER